MSEYQHLKDQFDEISARQKAKQEAPLREEIAALTRRVDELNNAHAAVVSCHHMGEDSACLECMACERYDHHATQRRLAQVAVELERVASERDTARELANDAVQARDKALACEAAARGLLAALSSPPSPTSAEGAGEYRCTVLGCDRPSMFGSCRCRECRDLPAPPSDGAGCGECGGPLIDYPNAPGVLYCERACQSGPSQGGTGREGTNG